MKRIGEDKNIKKEKIVEVNATMFFSSHSSVTCMLSMLILLIKKQMTIIVQPGIMYIRR